MARIKDREKALTLRLKGKSYSEIKNELGVSKSTLSYWLCDYPLSPERIKQLRDWNPRRIENFRNTMRLKKEKRLEEIYKKVAKDIRTLTKRELFITGFFLYWAEGTKNTGSELSFANTDPTMIKFFIKWLNLMGVETNRLKARLHLYSDMNTKKEIAFWSLETGIPIGSFWKPYIKKTRKYRIIYKGRCGHGTCNVRFANQPIADYVLMGMKHIRERC